MQQDVEYKLVELRPLLQAVVQRGSVTLRGCIVYNAQFRRGLITANYCVMREIVTPIDGKAFLGNWLNNALLNLLSNDAVILQQYVG